MNKTLYLLLGALAGAITTYLYFNTENAQSGAGVASQADFWGNKQRVSGAGNTVLGQVKQGIGEATGNDKLAGDGLLDQAKGAVKSAAGQAAHAAVDAFQDASK